MDILKPALIWVDGRCYRFVESNLWSNTRDITPYIEDGEQLDYEEEDPCDADIEIVPYGATTFKHTFHVANAFFPIIIGSKNAVRQKLESETMTVIRIPEKGQDGDVVITGMNRRGIISARRRIDLLIEASRKHMKPMHFLSIPLNDGHIIMKFNSFKNDVLNIGNDVTGIDNTIFQTPSKLHLTIGMLVLLDDAEKNQATEALHYCEEHIIKPIMKKYKQITIRLQGIDIMNDDPAEARIIYAKVVNGDNGLREIVDKIADHYESIGLLSKKKGNQVKLHVTLINVKFKDLDNKETNYTTDLFDATEILKAHSDTFFGETTLKQIHISQRSTISNNGYYQAIAKINLLDM